MAQYANSWRSGPDHHDEWKSTADIIERNSDKGKYAGAHMHEQHDVTVGLKLETVACVYSDLLRHAIIYADRAAEQGHGLNLVPRPYERGGEGSMGTRPGMHW